MANRTEELKLIISGDGRLLSNEIKKEEQQIKGFANRTKSIFSGMRKSINSGLGKVIGNPFTGLLSTAGIMYAGSKVIDFDDKIASLQNQFTLTDKATLELRQSIIQTADDARQSWDDVIDSAIELADKTGNLTIVKDGLTGIGVAAKGTSSEMLDIAKISAGMNQNMGILPGQFKEAFNILAAQGDIGSFVFREMATNAERLTAAAAQLDLNGLQDLKEYGAFLQMIRPSFGSADEASTMVKNIMVRIKTEAKKIRKETGFDVYDSAGKLKPFKDIIEGIVKGSKGSVVKLNNIFGEAAIAFTMFNQELSKGRGFEKFEAYIEAAGSDVLWNKFLVKSATAKSSLQLLSNVGMRATDKLLAKPITAMSLALNDMLKDPSKLKQFEETISNIGDVVTIMAKGIMLSVKGWGEIIGLVDKAAAWYGNWETVRAQWKLIPEEKQKELYQKYNIGRVPYAQRYQAYNSAINEHQQTINQNIINLKMQIAQSGRSVVESSDPNTTVNTSVNRGTFPGVRKK